MFPTPRSGTSALPQGTETLRILAVDDDPAEFALIENGFARCGIVFELITATTASLALATIVMGGSAEIPHVALVDINMPLVSGFELAAQLGAQQVPTILMSTQVDARRASMAREIGALDLLAKPHDINGYSAFAARVLRIINLRS